MKGRFSTGLLILIIICILLLIISGLTYYANFKNASISNETSDWGSFSDYIAPFISLANLILIGFITVFINKTNLLVERPTIIFKIDDKRESYFIENIGKGAALNIIIKHKNNRNNTDWDSKVLCYSIGQNDKLKIFWKKSSDEWIAYYDDIFDNHYYTDIKDDYLKLGKITAKEYNALKEEHKEVIWNVTMKD